MCLNGVLMVNAYNVGGVSTPTWGRAGCEDVVADKSAPTKNPSNPDRLIFEIRLKAVMSGFSLGH
jgi:hypothetical protein